MLHLVLLREYCHSQYLAPENDVGFAPASYLPELKRVEI